jgi:cyclohexanecarboxyl-CoA dehydrogenase
MLGFAFNEEQNMIRTMVKDFGKKEIAPGLKSRMEARTFPKDLIKKMGEQGFMGLNIADKYGGELKEAVTLGVILEELCRYGGDAGIYVFNAYASASFVNLAAEEVKAEWLSAMAKGETTVNMGATEAEAGSDLGNLKTFAKKDGDYYIINGEKNRVSCGAVGDAAIVLAKTDSSRKSITPFLVPYSLPGISRSPIRDMGSESTEASILSLEDVRVHKNYLLGDEEGRGFVETMRTFDCNRALLGLMALAKAAVSVDESCEYVKQRVQFGKQLAKFEALSFKLAEAATQIELGRWLCYKALWMKDQGLRHSKESAMAKWWCTQTAAEIIHNCLLIHGHYGYSQDLPFECRLKEVIGEQIGDGAPEIMKIIIAREIIGREAIPY